MAEYAAATMATVTAMAAIVGSSGANRQRERERLYRGGYRTSNTDENSPWQQHPRQHGPFANTIYRRANNYYGQPLYYPPGLHEHYVHHAACPASQCHYQAFLIDSVQRYNEARQELRETYVVNVRELARVHAAQPRKPARDKAAEADRLYSYYVSRVRDVFEDHRRDHRRLFGQDYLTWARPEREDAAGLPRRSRAGSRGGSEGDAQGGDGAATTASPKEEGNGRGNGRGRESGYAGEDTLGSEETG